MILISLLPEIFLLAAKGVKADKKRQEHHSIILCEKCINFKQKIVRKLSILFKRFKYVGANYIVMNIFISELSYEK